MVANKFKQQGTILFKKSWATTTYASCFVKSSKMSFTQVVFSEENENINSKTYQTIVSVRWYTDARASNHGRFRTFVSPLAKSSFPLANFQINFQVSVYILQRAS